MCINMKNNVLFHFIMSEGHFYIKLKLTISVSPAALNIIPN